MGGWEPPKQVEKWWAFPQRPHYPSSGTDLSIISERCCSGAALWCKVNPWSTTCSSRREIQTHGVPALRQPREIISALFLIMALLQRPRSGADVSISLPEVKYCLLKCCRRRHKLAGPNPAAPSLGLISPFWSQLTLSIRSSWKALRETIILLEWMAAQFTCYTLK